MLRQAQQPGSRLLSLSKQRVMLRQAQQPGGRLLSLSKQQVTGESDQTPHHPKTSTPQYLVIRHPMKIHPFVVQFSP
jgi:hypothetical protein